MSKTVLLSDDLHKQIQDSKIEMNWVEIKMSIAKKIELFFDWYMMDQNSWKETLQSFRQNNSIVWNDLQDEKIRADKSWANPWKITSDVSIKL